MSNLKPSEAAENSASIAAADVFAVVTPTAAITPEPSEQKGENGESVAPLLPLLPAPIAANDAAPSAAVTPSVPANDDEADDVYTPAPVANPVLVAIRHAGLYLEPLGGGRHRLTCPWATEHGSDATVDAEYAEPDRLHPVGTFRCANEHGERPDMDRVLVHLGLTSGAARAKPRIRIAPGEVHRAAAAAERVLEADGTYFQAGGPLVRIAVDPRGGGVSSELVNDQTLISVLSAKIDWEKRERAAGWVRADPPSSVVQMLLKGQVRDHLPNLAGLARQPFYRADGTLVTTPGYDAASGVYAAFNPAHFVFGEPTRDAAERSLHYLQWLLRDFHFASPNDMSAAVCAMLTAAVRTSLPRAPAFNISATRSGSGKSYLAELIVPFAGPDDPHNVSYPTTAEEATKVVLAMLLERPTAILFDDMQTDWKPFTALNKALTSPTVTERILGSTRTATASTNVLILGTGNNVEPERDMRRRVVSIYLAPPGEAPALLKYGDDPVGHVRRDRGRAVCAALTIIEAHKAAGQPLADVTDIGTFGTWTALCRQPLLWLGEPDPATSLIEQVTHDPDQERLADLLRAWAESFTFQAVTVRKVVDKATEGSALLDALVELPVMDGRYVDPKRLGWFLKKNRGRIADGYRIEDGNLSERKSWKVVPV